MKEKTFFQSISIFTCRIWLHYNNARGDTRHSYQNDFSEDLKRVNHRLGYRALLNMIQQYRAAKQFKNVIIYDNVNDIPVYDEVYNQKFDSYRIRLNCNLKFEKDEKGNWFYLGYESYSTDTGELFLNVADQYRVRSICKDAYSYLLKRQQMPQDVHSKASQDAIQQVKVRTASVHSNLEGLRGVDSLKNLSNRQLSDIADMLLKMKGAAA